MQDSTLRMSYFQGVKMRWSQLDIAWRWALKLWLVCELLFVAWTAWVSSIFPRTLEEAHIPLWPIITPLHTWLERIVFLPIMRYDVEWYLDIAQFGYGYKTGDTAFHPLYPLLMNLLGRLFGGTTMSYMLAGWLIAQLCTILMLVLLYRLVKLDHDDKTARLTTLFLLISPVGFVFLIPYTEPLFVLTIVATFYAARRQHWWLMGCAGAAAVLTKQPGAFLILPLLLEIFYQRWHATDRLVLRAWLKPLLSIAFLPLALLGWIVYRASLGDASISLLKPASLIEIVLTPTYKDTWGVYFSWPWVNFGLALEQMKHTPTFYLFLNMFIMFIMLSVSVYTSLHSRPSYSAYVLILAVMNLAIVYPVWPYMAIIRRFTILFPMFMQLARWGHKRMFTRTVFVCSISLWFLISAMYVQNAFIP